MSFAEAIFVLHLQENNKQRAAKCSQFQSKRRNERRCGEHFSPLFLFDRLTHLLSFSCNQKFRINLSSWMSDRNPSSFRIVNLSILHHLIWFQIKVPRRIFKDHWMHIGSGASLSDTKKIFNLTDSIHSRQIWLSIFLYQKEKKARRSWMTRR